MVGFTDLCIEAVECAYKELITETREEVSSALNDSFTSMIAGTKGKVFSGASVDEGYGIAVTSVQGFNAAENLSGGEDVCLALSFSQALGRVSGFALPLILDSPFIKLDPEAMVLVMRTMLENLGDRQLVLLMKTQEHDPGVERELDDAGVRSTYKLDFNEQVQSTSVAGW